METAFRVVEFYSGIGGFHFAVHHALPSAQVVAAFDIDEDANCVYSHSTGVAPTLMNLQTVPISLLESLAADVWLLSPPCQPYTRQGKQRDDQDPRAFSFLSVLKKLSQMQCPPEFVCVENVVGFEISRTRETMLEVFRKRELYTVEFILSPEQFGIPYSRPRYFCLARHHPFSLASDQIHFEIPNTGSILKCKLEDFLEEEVRRDLEVPEKFLQQCGQVMNVVGCGEEMVLNCFTKSYGGRYFKGTGSFLATRRTNWIPLVCVLQDLCSNSTQDTYLFAERSNDVQNCRLECAQLLTDLLRRMKIRYFSPTEVARFHSFPDVFEFPNHITLRRQYALLGNSLSVAVVTHLLQYLILHESCNE